MIDLSSIKGVYLYTGLTDRRSGIKRLSIKVASDFQKEDRTGCLFLFCGKNKKSLKALEFTEDGVWLYQKRLDANTFKWPKNIQETKTVLEERQLRRLLDGLFIVYNSHGCEHRGVIRY